MWGWSLAFIRWSEGEEVGGCGGLVERDGYQRAWGCCGVVSLWLEVGGRERRAYVVGEKRGEGEHGGQV